MTFVFHFSHTLMRYCWTEDPNERPSFFHLVSTISDKLESIAGYFDFGSTPLSVGKSLKSEMLNYDHLVPAQLNDETHDGNQQLNPVVIVSDEDSNHS